MDKVNVTSASVNLHLGEKSRERVNKGKWVIKLNRGST